MNQIVELINQRRKFFIYTFCFTFSVLIVTFSFKRNVYNTSFSIKSDILEDENPLVLKAYALKHVELEGIIEKYNKTFCKRNKFILGFYSDEDKFIKGSFKKIEYSKEIKDITQFSIDIQSYDTSKITAITQHFIKYINNAPVIKVKIEKEKSILDSLCGLYTNQITEMRSSKENIIKTADKFYFNTYNIDNDITNLELKKLDLRTLKNDLGNFKISMSPSMPKEPMGFNWIEWILISFLLSFLFSLFVLLNSARLIKKE